MNAILYVDRTGVPWRHLPHGFAPWATIYGYFATWQQDGVFEQLTGLLPRLVREAEGGGGEPSGCVLGSQTPRALRLEVAALRLPRPGAAAGPAAKHAEGRLPWVGAGPR